MDLTADEITQVREVARRAAWHLPAVWREDAVEGAVEAVWRTAQRYDESRGIEFKYYLGKRARGAVIDEWRRLMPGTRHTPAELPLSFDQMLADRSDEIPVTIEAAVDNLEFERLIALLRRPRDRGVMRALFCDDVTQVDIARVYGVSPSMICYIVGRCLRTLRKELEHETDDA